MVDEVDVEEIVGLFLGKLAFDPEEAMVERIRARPRDRRPEAFARGPPAAGREW